MNDLPAFAVAVDRFREFLRTGRHTDRLFWIFRDDLWLMRADTAWVRYPTPAENELLARKVYEEGRARGLVEIVAVVTDGVKVGATVWFPKFPEDKVQGWSQNLKLSVRQPLARFIPITKVVWRVVTRLPRYRAFQRRYGFVGTRKWAAA